MQSRSRQKECRSLEQLLYLLSYCRSHPESCRQADPLQSSQCVPYLWGSLSLPFLVSSSIKRTWSQVWWRTPLVAARGRQRQVDL